jgi:MFS-type transporter involved in bile tolerance (Atg22 family)
VVSVALVKLATEAAGCEMEADEECTGKVYGLNPVSLISGIPVVSGVLGAFLMPVIGVILDFTSYRRFVGVLFSAVFTVIQAVQIAIGEKTWFAMAILQAIAGFCFTIIILTTIAYLPEICEQVGQLKVRQNCVRHVMVESLFISETFSTRVKHAQYTSRFTGKQFSMQGSFLVLVSVLSYVLGIAKDSVQTARLCQALNFAITCIFFGLGWQRMPSRKATRELPEGMGGFRTIAYGIRQNIRTGVSIHRDYKKGLRWYLLATMFAQASVAALTSTSVVYLSAEVGLNATDTLLFFLVVLIGTMPGAKLASLVSKLVNPNTSWQLSMVSLFTAVVIGAFTLGDAPSKYLSLVWGFFVGIVLGWFYPTENLFFSCILPKGQEAEIAGFRVYCSTILAWMPPLVFSTLVENEIDPKWGLTFMGSFILIAAALLKFAAGTWEEILQESGRSNLSVRTDCL